jgi:hypothetical protein
MTGPLGFPMRIPHLNPVLLTVLIVWSLIWKGLALWRAARGGQAAWFVVLLFVNTAGLLEIVYLLFFAPRPHSSTG